MSWRDMTPRRVDAGLAGIHLPPGGERVRQVNPAMVKRLAASLRANGQLTPIIVREKETRGLMLGCWVIAGWHRVLAAKEAGLASLVADV